MTETVPHDELLPHLFRTEFRKIVAVLCRRLGIAQLEAAEDIASETFLLALETWSYKGIPPNPTAWLYAVAKNKTKNYLRREQFFSETVAGELKAAAGEQEEPVIDLSEQHIRDSQLQMLFAVCHPAISTEAQIGLALRVLCGFGIDEIATAFLSNKETINKRLFRAREKLREEKVLIAFPPDSEIARRLDTVLTTLYLLFSEGYYSESNDAVLRKDLCLEAIRLCYLLTENEATDTPPVNALLALMCFHTSRFEARKDAKGELLLYHEQDETLWNTDLIARGAHFLRRASTGDRLSKYHLEAGIAYWHTQKADTPEKWEAILQLYNQLLQVEYSPIAALNRTFALSKANGKAEAIREAEKLQLTGNQYYYALLGELYTGMDNAQAKLYYEQALSLTRTGFDRRVIGEKLQALFQI